jgi:predicted DsbA family dithiol-disulfide isomerase
VGLDRASFEAALDAAATTESIERDQAEEMRRAVNGSPAICIGEMRIDGLQAERVYKTAIDAAVAAQRNAQAAASGR